MVSAIGPSDLLCFTHQSFLENPFRLIFWEIPPPSSYSIIFSEIGPSDLLCFIPHPGRWLRLGGGSGPLGGENSLEWLKTVPVSSAPDIYPIHIYYVPPVLAVAEVVAFGGELVVGG